MNDPKIVFFNGSTVPEWYYENIRLVKTDKNCKKSKEFEIDELVLHPDGMIRLVRNNSSNTSKKQFSKRVPVEIVSIESRDGMRFCPVRCCKLVPAESFGNSVKNNTPNAYCTPCIKNHHASINKPDGVRAIRKAYIDRRRLELIRQTGCVHEGCDIYNHVRDWSDDYLLAQFEFNHKDGGLGAGNRLHSVSSYTWFTDQRAERLNLSNINTGQELWEAEVAKCEVLCHSHHVIFGTGQMAAKRQKRS